MNDETCYLCREPAYKHLWLNGLSRWVCRGHYVQALEAHLGKHAPKFEAYREAVNGGWKPTLLFQEMEMKP